MNNQEAISLKERRAKYNRRYYEKLHAAKLKEGKPREFKSDIIHKAVQKLSLKIDLRAEHVQALKAFRKLAVEDHSL